MKTIYSFLILILSGFIFAWDSAAATNTVATNLATNTSTNIKPLPLTNVLQRARPLRATNSAGTNAARQIVTTNKETIVREQVIVTPATNTTAATTNAAPPLRTVPLRGAGRTNISTLATPTIPTPLPNAPVPAAQPQTPPAVNVPAPTVPAPAAPPAVTPPKAAAVPDKNDDVPILSFEKMPVEQVLEFYSGLVGRTILRAPTLPITTFITLKAVTPLTKQETIQALETALGMNGITVVPIGTKFAKVVAEANAKEAGAAFSDSKPGDLPESGKYVTQIVQLKYIPAQEAITAISYFAKTPASIIPIGASQTLVLRDYSENVKRMMEMLEKIDIITPLEFKSEVIPIKYALAIDIQSVLGQLTASGPGTSVGRSTRAGGLANPITQQQGGTTGLPGQQPAQPTPFGGTTGTANRSSFQNRLSQIVQRASAGGEFQILGEAKIIADERTNSLLVFANDADMKMMKDIILKMDVVLAQVLIEAIIMEVSLNNGRDFGVSYLQRPTTGFSGSAAGVNNGQRFVNPVTTFTAGGTNSVQTLNGGLSYFTTIGSSLDVAVKAIATDSRVNVLSRPSIQTSHAVEASLFIGDTIPYVTGSYNGGSGFGNSSQYSQKEVGIRLNVLPLINPDGLVVMDIQQNIEQLGADVVIQGVGNVPKTTKRQAAAKVAVRDGETIILGGFISSNKQKNRTGVPYLKDIPFLGALFRQNTDSTARVELMVLMRPTVLPTPEAAALTATDEKNKLSGVKQAEIDIREEERRDHLRIENELRAKAEKEAAQQKKMQEEREKRENKLKKTGF